MTIETEIILIDGQKFEVPQQVLHAILEIQMQNSLMREFIAKFAKMKSDEIQKFINGFMDRTIKNIVGDKNDD